MYKTVKEYVLKALSLNNRKKFDGDSNAPYRVVIEMAEVGGDNGKEDGSFWFQVKIPRQVDNSLGMTIKETTNERSEAIQFLRELITQLEKQAEEEPEDGILDNLSI